MKEVYENAIAAIAEWRTRLEEFIKNQQEVEGDKNVEILGKSKRQLADIEGEESSMKMAHGINPVRCDTEITSP